MSHAETPTVRSSGMARNYTLACLTGLAVLLFALMQRGLGWSSLVPVLIGSVALPTRWRLGPVLLLLAVEGVLFIDALQVQRGHMALRKQPTFSLADLFLCGAVLAYVAGHFRLQGLVKNIFPQDPRRPPTPSRRSPRRAGPAGIQMVPVRRTGRLASTEEIAAFILIVVFCAGLASFGWLWLVGLPPRFIIAKELWRGIVLVWVLGIGLIAAGGLLSYLGWRRMTQEEATLFLQDAVWTETYREQWRLQDWLAWSRLRQQKRKEEA